MAGGGGEAAAGTLGRSGGAVRWWRGLARSGRPERRVSAASVPALLKQETAATLREDRLSFCFNNLGAIGI